MLKDLLKLNRSYRGYDESYTVTEEQLRKYVDLTRYAASSVNLQPLKYHISYEKDEVAAVQSMTKWARALPDMTLPHDGMHPTAFIIICQDTELAPNTAMFLKDVGIVAQTVLLAAVEDGIGGCMIGNFPPDKISEMLGFPENIVPLLILAIGKPAETVVLTDVKPDGSTKYYRDENDVHYVPKRKLEDLFC
ncbi:MAG: nitroreductase family protein [Clostridiales bacterium]|nr:nitroreductase family protein [Clostridiales bacterium]